MRGAIDGLLAEVVRRLAGTLAGVAAGGAGLAAGRAPGAEAMPVLAAHHDDGARMADLQLVFDAEPAAMLAGPFGIRAQAEAAHQHRRLGFQHLDRHVAQEGDREFRAGDAVPLRAAAGAAGHRVGDHHAAGLAEFGRRDVGDDHGA